MPISRATFDRDSIASHRLLAQNVFVRKESANLLIAFPELQYILSRWRGGGEREVVTGGSGGRV